MFREGKTFMFFGLKSSKASIFLTVNPVGFTPFVSPGENDPLNVLFLSKGSHQTVHPKKHGPTSKYITTYCNVIHTIIHLCIYL